MAKLAYLAVFGAIREYINNIQRAALSKKNQILSKSEATPIYRM